MQIFGNKKNKPCRLIMDHRSAQKQRFDYQEPGEDKAHVFATEIFGEDEGDMPMDKPLIIKKIQGLKIVSVIGLQCVFIESAGKNFYVFKSILSGDIVFMKFKEVVNVYVIHDWETFNRRSAIAYNPAIIPTGHRILNKSSQSTNYHG